jgi:hypothetical protein
MRKFLSLFFVLIALMALPLSVEAIAAEGEQPTNVTFDFTLEGEQSLRGYVGTAMTDVKGYVYNETFEVGNTTLQITAGSAPSRIYKDNNRGVNLVIYNNYGTLQFVAPEGYAIKQIDFTAAGNSNIDKFVASSGNLEGMKWTGNAEGVRFVQGGTSYLANAIVTLAVKDDNTDKMQGIPYVACENIAAFNALEDGTYAKVMLTDAELTGVSADGYSTMWIQDATGGCWIQYTSLIVKYLEPNNKVNGYFYVVKRSTSGNPQMKEAIDTPESDFTQTPIGEPAIIEGTLAEVNVAANLNKVVKITGATLEETSATAGKLTQGDITIDVNNGTETANQQLHKIAEWAKDTKLENITMVAILVAKSATANQLLPISISSVANDGTKEHPYNVSELLAQKEDLATSGKAVWVKADLKGLGVDGQSQSNVDTENGGKTVKNMAALFGDATGEFIAYSWQILGQLDMADLTNTKDLLICLTYGTADHPYGNSANPQYASHEEPADAHFSLEEVHGALSLEIKNGFRGYHIPSCYVVPNGVVAARVSSNYTASKGATIAYGYYNGAEEGKTYIINKNTALVLMAADGTYDFVLSAGYYEQINSNSLNGGEKAGVNTIPMKNNALRYHYRFVANGEKVGFERNCAESTEVNLASKDEVYLTINGAENHFFGNWTWETEDKNWISWAGSSYSETGVQSIAAKTNNKATIYSLQGVRQSQLKRGLNIVGTKKVLVK